MAIYPIWKFVQAITQDNTAYIFVYGFVSVFYVVMLIYIARTNYKVKKFYKSKNADNLVRELGSNNNE